MLLARDENTGEMSVKSSMGVTGIEIVCKESVGCKCAQVLYLDEDAYGHERPALAEVCGNLGVITSKYNQNHNIVVGKDASGNWEIKSKNFQGTCEIECKTDGGSGGECECASITYRYQAHLQYVVHVQEGGTFIINISQKEGAYIVVQNGQGLMQIVDSSGVSRCEITQMTGESAVVDYWVDVESSSDVCGMLGYISINDVDDKYILLKRNGNSWSVVDLKGISGYTITCKDSSSERRGVEVDEILDNADKSLTEKSVNVRTSVQEASGNIKSSGIVPVVVSDYKTDYAKLDYGMPRRCAFAICAKGDVNAKFKENLISKLKWYAPGVDIVDIDVSEAGKHLPGIDRKTIPCFARLAIPLMSQFKKYDRVIYMDVNIDIVSGLFSGILSEVTGESGVAASENYYQKFFVKHINEDVRPGHSIDRYFNSGLLVLDLFKIDRKDWRERLSSGLHVYEERHFKWLDQDLLNGWFDVSEVDRRYNHIWSVGQEESDPPYAIHYCNKGGATCLLDMLCGNDISIDAVFVIGTGSQNGNEELRYALRNLDAHCKFVRNVYICGECPEWVDKSVVKHLPWPDRFKHAKDSNIIDKLRHVCETNGIAKRILFCSDDQFQTRPCEWEDFYPRYLRQYDTSDSWYADKNREWHNRLRATLERDVKRRMESGLDAKNVYYWQPHIWMQIDRDRFIEYAKWSDYEHRKDTIIASGYFNYIDTKPISHKHKDHAFIGDTDEMPNVTHIAYTDGYGYDSAMRWLTKKFPRKCRFEVGGSPEAYSGRYGDSQDNRTAVDAVKAAMLQRFN